MNTAVYARSVTVLQNPDDQIELVKPILEGNYEIYIDYGISGTIPMFERPCGKQIYDKITHKQIDCLVVSSLDRISRNMVDLFNVLNFCLDNGVRVTSVCEGEITREWTMPLSVITEWERRAT